MKHVIALGVTLLLVAACGGSASSVSRSAAPATSPPAEPVEAHLNDLDSTLSDMDGSLAGTDGAAGDLALGSASLHAGKRLADIEAEAGVEGEGAIVKRRLHQPRSSDAAMRWPVGFWNSGTRYATRGWFCRRVVSSSSASHPDSGSSPWVSTRPRRPTTAASALG